MVVNRSREEWKTYGNVFDKFTESNLRKLSSQGYFEELESTVALGKEANVFIARTKENTHIIVKIYRLENCNFNKMLSYIVQDPRYMSLKGQKRKIIFAWTQREYRNLLKSREFVRVPTPIVCKENIVLMELIDEGGDIAQKLKDADLPHPQKTFDEVIAGVRKLFKGGLVHGDLSEFNILIQQGQVVFIDLSQMTTTDSSNAPELLKRDIHVICSFFNRKGLNVVSSEVYAAVIK